MKLFAFSADCEVRPPIWGVIIMLKPFSEHFLNSFFSNQLGFKLNSSDNTSKPIPEI